MDGTEGDSRASAAWTAVALVLFASLGGAVVVAEWPVWGISVEESEDPQLVEPVEGGTELWPYTARSPDHSARTLGVNVVIKGDPTDVRRAMTDRSELEWQETAPGERADPPRENESQANATQSEGGGLEDVGRYGEADGALRYTYIVTDESSRWLTESYQLHSGTYLGQRMHIRAYDDPNGNWTAMQAHNEHWDWFRLRHTVTGISDAQREVERDFMGVWFVNSLTREPYQHATADGDGWATSIEITLLLLPAVGILAATRFRHLDQHLIRLYQQQAREVSIGVSLLVLYLGIRFLGILLEGRFPHISPRYLAAPLYLILAIGTPTLARWLGRDTDPVWAFTHTVGGLGTAFVVDFVAMGVSVVPLRFILHRVAVLSSIGLIAVGETPVGDDNSRIPLFVGLAGWIIALVLPLFGYI